MVKPRGKVIYQGKSPGTIGLGATGIRIGAWCPDEKAEAPPEQVHLHFTVEGLEDMPMILRFKSPDTLGIAVGAARRDFYAGPISSRSPNRIPGRLRPFNF